MSSIITNVGAVVRAWTDVSSKIKAAAAGGFTAGGVTSILAVVFPDWHPAAWLVGLITLAAAVIAGYLKGDKLTIGATVVGTGADGTVTSSPVSVDLPALPLVPELAAVIKAQDEVGADEDIDAPKHLAD